MKAFLAWWRQTHKAKLYRGLVFLLLWLALLDFPRDVAGDELDFSWMQCLGHFLKNRAQCGVDYVWTYGPLGYFTQAVYDADLFWWKFVWELIVKFIFAWILLRWATMLGSGWAARAVRRLVVGLPCRLRGRAVSAGSGSNGTAGGARRGLPDAESPPRRDHAAGGSIADQGHVSTCRRGCLDCWAAGAGD